MSAGVWLTAREIAAENLPGLPQSRRAIADLAEREGWNTHPAHARPRAGRGGGMEYALALMPTVWQVAYTRRHKVAALVPATLPTPLDARPLTPAEASLTDRAREERDARLAIVAAHTQFAKTSRLGTLSSALLFVERYNRGAAKLPDWVTTRVPRLSRRSLLRWRAARTTETPLGFDRGAARRGTGTLDTASDGELRRFALALLAQQPHLSAAHVRTLCRSEFGDQIEVVSKGVRTSVPMPPVRTFQHFLKGLKADHAVELTKLADPDRFRSTMALSGVGTLRHVGEPNALWMIDASPADALCTDGRHQVYACIDVATRRTLLYVSRTARASAVALLMRKAVMAWGVPAAVKTDNGSDFTAKDTQRLLAALGIEVQLSDAYSPQQKGHVERVIGTFQRDLVALLPGFVGHSVTDRKRIEARKDFASRLGASDAETFDVRLSGADLQDACDRWAGTIYQHRAHDGLKGQTPYAVAAASAAPVRRVDERALDVLLMPVAGTRTVTKFGIRIDGRHYLLPSVLPGRVVMMRMDPHDLGRAYAFDGEHGQFLGEAVCPEYSGLHPQTVVKAAKELQAELLAERTAGTKRLMREVAKGRPLFERALEVAARDVPNVTPFPARTTPHTTPAIVAALAVGRAPEPVPMSPTVAAMHEALTREAEGLAAEREAAAVARVNVKPIRTKETPHQRFARALAVEAAIAGGAAVDPAEALWLGGYRTGPEWRAMSAMRADLEAADRR